MRFFYDTEFIEDGDTIELVSIGIVAEDGREYYAVSTDADHSRANKWVQEHVVNQLPSPSDKAWKSNERIRAEVEEFLLGTGTGSTQPGERPQLWAWVGAYDHVLLAQLWGDMSELPRQIPHFTHELRQYWEFAGRPPLPPVPDGNHDALVDARHNLAKFRQCQKYLPIAADNAVIHDEGI